MQDAGDLHVGELAGPFEGMQGTQIETRLIGRELLTIRFDFDAVWLIVQDVADQMQWFGHGMPPFLPSDMQWTHATRLGVPAIRRVARLTPGRASVRLRSGAMDGSMRLRFGCLLTLLAQGSRAFFQYQVGDTGHQQR